MHQFSLKRCLGIRSNCFLRCVVLVYFISLALFMILMSSLVTQQENPNSSSQGDKKRSRVIKDAFHIVTAAGAQEFKHLLKLLDSLTRQESTIEMWVWSLDLSACQVEYIENLETNFRIRIEQFPYHSYPLHIRLFHLVAIRPIVLDIASKTYGQALWLNPTSVLLTDLPYLIGKIGGSEGNVILTDGAAIGINYHKYENFLKIWVKCVKTESCIKKYASKTDLHTNDEVVRDFMSQYKLNYERFNGIQDSNMESQSPSLVYWENSASKLCSLHKVCVLTGSHQSHGCLTPQLRKLRRNKEKYSASYGYTYIEETYGFHKHGPCTHYWNKIQAILKHLPDCNVLLWVDTDCIFTNFKTSVDFFFEKYPEKDILMSWPTTDRMLNAGVILMRNTPSVKAFFHNATTGIFWTGDWCHGGKNDQAGLRDQVNAGTLRDKVVVEKNDKFLQGLCGFKNGMCKWKENEYIVHFAPPDCPQLHDLVRDFFDKYPQLAG